jgi:tetratricopeptide (TPR) repeat protein
MESNSDLQRVGQTVGAKLRAARLARKYTQSELAQPDFSVSYVSAIERGQIHPSLRALEIFAQRLGLTSSDLLSKQTGQGLPEKDATNENKQDIELQLLEAQLLIIRGNCREAVTLLHNLSSDALKSHQKIRQRYLLGRAFYHSGLLQESESVLTEASKLATDLNDFFVKHILDVLGMVRVSMRNHTQGFKYQLPDLDQLEKEQQPHDVFFDAQVCTNIGLQYVDLDKIDDAIEMFQHALAITKEFLAPDRLTSMYWDISRYLAETQNYFLATLYGYKTLQLLVLEYCDSMRSEMYQYLGQAMLHEDQRKAVIYLERLLQDGSLEKDTLAFASVMSITADALCRQGEMKKAYEYAQKACKLALAYGDRIVTASIFLTFGSIACAQEDYQVGDAQFMAGLSMLERLNNRQELADKSAIYAQLLEKRGLPDEALKFYKKAYESSLEHK